ncbi:hypothetical protein AVEN_53354-1 [Araneus ventricosus]|uniref:Uncharacterized protein n=1 Tax=Araneus ventricosus TaxID=182803 RepID=A0A4Y2ABK6_ARAVE|nr:hypothetical protein AVEN_53354-1 [Araneus ventricosus]
MSPPANSSKFRFVAMIGILDITLEKMLRNKTIRKRTHKKTPTSYIISFSENIRSSFHLRKKNEIDEELSNFIILICIHNFREGYKLLSYGVLLFHWRSGVERVLLFAPKRLFKNSTSIPRAILMQPFPVK